MRSASKAHTLDSENPSRNINFTMTRPRLARIFSILAALALLAGSRALADHHETWVEVRSPHFTVLSNAGEHEGRLTAEQFEEIRSMFEQRYPKLRVDAGKPTVIFALKNEDSLKLFLPSYGTNPNAMKLGGLYRMAYDRNYALVRTDIRGQGPFPYHALYHEYTHAYFRLNYRGLPLWLNEGLAEFYGNTKIEGKEVKIGLVGEQQLRLLQNNPLLPVSTLVTIDGTSPLYNTRDHSGIFYAESWAVVHYFMLAPEVHEENLLNKFLANLRESDDPIEAANQSFGDLNALGNKLEEYAHQTKFGYGRLALSVRVSENDFTARTLTPAEGLLAQAGYLLRSNHLPEGLEILHQVEARDPKAPGYHTELGYYHLQKADYEKALQEFELALAADPGDLSAHLYTATALYRESEYTEESTPKIRSELEKVLALNANFAPAYAFLSVAYTKKPSPNNQKALDAAVRASRMEPGNLAYYLDIGWAFLADGKFSEARKIADLARKTSSTPRERTLVTMFTKRIDAKATQASPASGGLMSESEMQGTEPTPTTPVPESVHAEGRITELICGHPPEVVLTLATASDSMLLHIKDVAKIEILAGREPSDASSLPCTSWKDRRAEVDFQSTPGGITKGEIRRLSLE
jgi:tetratricopeptide (TPR) repeat protein